jgi:hypothetical protein
MRSSRIALAAAIALAFITPQAIAEEVAETSPELLEEPAAPPAAEASTPSSGEEVAEASEVEATTNTHVVELGPMGLDEEGRSGRIHVVARGDTLWDISDAYLGTPWVWPSVWRENREIENPHLILPGERIWITATEMRRVTEEEAEQLLSAAPSAEGAVPAAMEDGSLDLGDGVALRPTYRYTEIDTSGFVTVDEVAGATTIVDSHEPRVWLGESDTVIIGRGAGEIEVGDQFEIFRTGERVHNPVTGGVFGFATKQLGWLEIKAVHPETATGLIRLSRSEIRRGDHVLPRIPRDSEIEIGTTPNVNGRIVFTPDDRLNMSTDDVVYLDRGTSDGLAVGSPLEVYRPIGTAVDSVRGVEVALPDDVVAKLLVVRARDQAAVAVVTHATVELVRGDRFRGSDSVERSSLP